MAVLGYQLLSNQDRQVSILDHLLSILDRLLSIQDHPLSILDRMLSNQDHRVSVQQRSAKLADLPSLCAPLPSAGFPTRKPFRPFAQRYALLLPEAPANARQRPISPGGGSNGGVALPLTPTGFIDWFALSEAQVGL